MITQKSNVSVKQINNSAVKNKAVWNSTEKQAQRLQRAGGNKRIKGKNGCGRSYREAPHTGRSSG